MRRSPTFAVLCSLALAMSLGACGGPEAPADGGIDAGGDREDAGRDAGSDDAAVEDAAVDGAAADDAAVDAGVEVDASLEIDAGTDAGETIDAGTDAGDLIDAGVDGGAEIDAGLDGGIDGGVDGGIDGGIDAGIDGGIDAGPPTCATDDDCAPALTCLSPSDVCGCPAALAPTDDPGATPQTLVLSEIDPGAYIELYNNTGSPIALSSSAAWLCSPFVYASLSSVGAGITVPAFGYATIPWPAGFTDTDAGGELQLFASAAFGDASQIIDFVCWGVNPHGTRISQAFTAGKWSGSTAASCAPALTGGAIHRRPATDGVDAADYDTTSRRSPATCAP